MKNENKKINKDTSRKVAKEAKKNMKKAVDEYKNFALKGNIVDLAIGMVIGSAFTSIVNALVSTTITPIISLLTNKVNLSTLFITLSGVHYATIEESKAAGAITWDYGTLLNALLNFFIVSITLFLVVKYLKHIKKKTSKIEEETIKDTTKECKYCLSLIPLNATKCAYCTSNVEDSDETINN